MSHDESVQLNVETLPVLPAGAPTTGRPHVPGYLLLEELGRGGMGVVYKARQVALARDVALKMILSGAHAGPDDLARFHAEAMAVAKLQHPNIVQIFEVGESDGRPFIALEYVGGGSLAEKLEGKPQSPRASAELALTLAEAVDFAHKQGIVHRDLKPANILMAEGGVVSSRVASGVESATTHHSPLSTHQPKITDFGLAKHLDGGTGRTVTGDVVGTPAYMAPEQAGGATKQIGPACDVYALGAILYEMLTGRPPVQRLDPLETLLAVISEEPLSLRRLQPGVSRDLETIAMKCLEKSPRRRYAQAQDLADDLRRFLRNEPIAARPTPAWERAVKWARRRPAQAVTVAAGLLGMLALVSGFAWHSRSLSAELKHTDAERQRADLERRQADQQRQRADLNLVLAQGIVHGLITRGGGEGLAPLAQNDPQREELLHLALDFCQGLLKQNPDGPGLREQIGLAHKQTADILQIFGRFDQALAEYRSAVGTLSEIGADDGEFERARGDLAGAYNNLGNLLRTAGRLDEAESAYRSAQDLFSRLAADVPGEADYRRQLAATFNNLGILLKMTGRQQESARSLSEAVARYEALVEGAPDSSEYRESLASSRNNLAVVYDHLGDAPRAEETYRDVIKVYSDLRAAEPKQPKYRSDLAFAYSNLAGALKAQQKLDDAAGAYQTSISLWEQLATEFANVPNYSLRLGETLNNFGILHGRLGHVDESIAAFERARELFERLPADTANVECREGLAVSLNALAGMASMAGDLSKAQELAEAALGIRRELARLQPDDVDTKNALATTLQTLAELSEQQGNHTAARDYLLEAISFQQAVIEARPNVVNYRLLLRFSYDALARTSAQNGDVAQAFAAVERLVQVEPAAAVTRLTVAELIGLLMSLADAKGAAFDREKFSRLAIEQLRGAMDRDGVTPEDIGKSAALTPLHQRADFQDLLK
jgi:serine/threonine protein kinase